MGTVANTSIFDFDEMDGVDKTVDMRAMALSEVDLNKSPDPQEAETYQNESALQVAKTSYLEISKPTPSTSPESQKFFSIFYKKAGKKSPSSPGQKRSVSIHTLV